MSEYEYPNPKKLHGDESVYFQIPYNILTGQDTSPAIVAAFSFLSVCRGLDGRIATSINYMSQWLFKKPDRHKGGNNDKLVKSIEWLRDNGYVTFDEPPKNSQMTCIEYDADTVYEECSESRFAMVYLDEVKKILSYEEDGAAESYAMLMVFAYLRMMIPRRPNKLRAIDQDSDTRRENCPEAYTCYYSDIADDLGVSERIVSKSVKCLEDMKLIRCDLIPRSENGGKWFTNHTMFCNEYKREGKNLLDSGDKYCDREFANKKKKIVKR